jgi:hypothetical protein
MSADLSFFSEAKAAAGINETAIAAAIIFLIIVILF